MSTEPLPPQPQALLEQLREHLGCVTTAIAELVALPTGSGSSYAEEQLTTCISLASDRAARVFAALDHALQDGGNLPVDWAQAQR